MNLVTETDQSDFYLRAMGFAQIETAIDELLTGFVPDAQLAEPVAVDPLAVPFGSCPKCIALRLPSHCACPACGLDYSRFHPSQVEPSAPLVESFISLGPVSELALHLRLLTRAQVLGELPQVVRLYRITLAREPHSVIARAVLDEAVKLASVTLQPVPVEDTKQSQTLRNVVLFILGNAFIIAVAAKTLATL